MNVTVTVKLPIRVVRRLEWLAGDSGKTVADEIAAAIRNRIGDTKTELPTTRQRVNLLVRSGLPDADIARKLDISNSMVSQHRRSLGLSANRRYRKN